MTVSGVDGCRGGWIVVSLDEGRCSWSRHGLEQTDAALSAGVVAVDIPIGLPQLGPRACDRLARRRLGARAATVFPAPRRPVLQCSTYREARVLLGRLGGPSMSAQAWGIVAAVRAVDDVITVADENRIVEAHPEVAFAVLNGGLPLAAKTTAPGLAGRRDLLSRWRPDAVDALYASGLPVVDGLDALACAWVAERWRAGDAEVLTDGARDGRGLLMRIAA